MIVIILLAYLVLSFFTLGALAFWAGRRRHPAVLAGALFVTIAAVGLVVYAFTGTVPLPRRRPWETSLAHALAPLLWLLPLLPQAVCVAAAQTCLRFNSSPGIARAIAFAWGALMVFLAPLAFLGSAQGLTGVSL